VIRLLGALVVALVLISCAGQAVTRPAAMPAVDAVKEVIQRANQAQAKAYATGDTSVMRDTATAAYFDELARTNSDLARSGVTAFELVRLEWRDVTIDGNTAHASTDETWRTTYADGSTDERSDRNEYTLVVESGSWKIQSDDQPDARRVDPPTAPMPDGSTTPARLAGTSSNWSGYVATGGTYTSVTGTWTVPQVSTTTAGADATWVGIGGVSASDLIQAGTQATVTGSGVVEYEAWTETLPQSTRRVPLQVRAGDSVTVTLSEDSSAQWLIVMVNNTTHETYRTTLRYTSSRSSAEWIEEAPSAGRGLVPLDDFGTVRFTASSAVRDGQSLSLAALGARSVAMINGAQQTIAAPTALDASGAGFGVTRTQAARRRRITTPSAPLGPKKGRPSGLARRLR